MATFQKLPDGRWRAQVARKGVRSSQIHDTKLAAQRWAHGLEEDILASKAGKFPQCTLEEAIERYKTDVTPTKAGEREELVRFGRITKTLAKAGVLRMQLVDLQSVHFAKWRDARLSEKTKNKLPGPATVLRESNQLGAVLTKCRREWKLMDHNPLAEVDMPEPPEPRKRMATGMEIWKILHALNYKHSGPLTTKKQETALAYLICLRTSMRSGEVLGLTGGQVDLKRRVVRIGGAYNASTRTKNGHSREIAITKEAARLLARVKGKDDEKLFTVESGTRDTYFREARDKAGAHDLHFHDSRRTAATSLSRKLPLLALASITGHRDLKILQSTYYGETAASIAQML